MKMKVFLLSTLLSACSHNPHKAEKIDTHIEKPENINGETRLGVKDGDMIVQRKVDMAEELRRLQYEVFEMEDRVYGNRRYGSSGLYGVLRECRAELSDKRNGGEGKLMWTEPKDRVTAREDDFKIGFDDKEKIVGVSEEFLKDRIQRFRGYRNILEQRQDEYEEKNVICQAELRSRRADKEKDRQQAGL